MISFKDKLRSCVSCGKVLNLYDFAKVNMTVDLSDLEAWWEDIRIELFCCTCHAFIYSIKRKDDFSELFIHMIKKKYFHVYKKFQKFGII